MKGRLILGVMVAAAVVFGVSGVAFSDSSPTIKGMVGGDFDTQLPPGGQNGADWGVDASFPRPANTVIHDSDVKVVGAGSGDSTDPFTCSGSVTNPTARCASTCSTREAPRTSVASRQRLARAAAGSASS